MTEGRDSWLPPVAGRIMRAWWWVGCAHSWGWADRDQERSGRGWGIRLSQRKHLNHLNKSETLQKIRFLCVDNQPVNHFPHLPLRNLNHSSVADNKPGRQSPITDQFCRQLLCELRLHGWGRKISAPHTQTGVTNLSEGVCLTGEEKTMGLPDTLPTYNPSK